ncbi:PREDICTED: uncharacterized protein LOC100636893, partial [Amphimedon queenslandica]|uniref:Uncharacterized protein n=1 Tax=Amphimedon queenslandica TaxID=400682 RepID=A0A1X7SGS5_AMPQE
MNLETSLVAAERGSTKVYNWDFAGGKWVNFSPTHKYSFIKIVQKKTLSGNEFFVVIEPDETDNTLRFHLPTDVQVTKTGDMIQFAVPDPQDPTGGKLIAIKFENKDLEKQFTMTASRRINGFMAIKPAQAPGEGSSSGQRSNDLNKPLEVKKQRPVYENTFSTDRYDGSSYQSPTLPSTGTGGAGRTQPHHRPSTAAVPAKPAVETKSNRSGEIGQYHQQP